MRIGQERLGFGQPIQKGVNLVRIGGGGVAEGVGLPSKLTNDDRQVGGVAEISLSVGDTHPKRTLKASGSRRLPYPFREWSQT